MRLMRFELAAEELGIARTSGRDKDERTLDVKLD